MINYKTGDLFQAPDLKDRIIVHACNAQGVWGSGFAKECKSHFPDLFECYEYWCKNNKNIVGKVFDVSRASERDGIKEENPAAMCCLITSNNYGSKVDSKELILKNTKSALNDIKIIKKKFISPKFNSGLFGVPWEQTEKLLLKFVEDNNLDWDVYTKEEK